MGNTTMKIIIVLIGLFSLMATGLPLHESDDIVDTVPDTSRENRILDDTDDNIADESDLQLHSNQQWGRRRRDDRRRRRWIHNTVKHVKKAAKAVGHVTKKATCGVLNCGTFGKIGKAIHSGAKKAASGLAKAAKSAGKAISKAA